ncbi:MAG TPA: flagellar filament outer layer protein FlaA [Spirochaetota bacterium]|nr:flagellar filament outer layer protein FlaA [Spirochaetota bacterium]HOM39165.1 flagellar filament outer layer protein FlaA [Spirochaetota bacterium]HPQ48342.1 flagellar filament outer layer protein FlaA [Spirochaetota bacterium]
MKKVLPILSISLILLGWSRDKNIPNSTEIKNHLIKTITLEDFEKTGQWLVKYSIYRRHSWKDPYSTKYDDSQKWITWKVIDPADYIYYGKPESAESVGERGRTVMGVRAKYYTKGYNWVSIEPKQQLFLIGDVISLRVWVWGGNYNYNLYVVLKNFQDKYYKVPLGNLGFKGWRQLSVNLKSYGIKQHDIWVPQLKPLEFIRFLVVSDVNERPDQFAIWFDDLQYDTDSASEFYYGKGLEKEIDWE